MRVERVAKQTLIDWQSDSIIVAHAARRSAGSLGPLRFEPVAPAGDAAGQSANEALRSAVSAMGLEKSHAIVLASREMLELRTVQVPRIEPDELPDVIRYQAQRQFAQINDAWIVDFVMLPDRPGDEMQTALVAALNPVHLSAIEAACEAAQVELEHIALGPIEIARYALGTGQIPARGVGLAVCLSETQAEIVLFRDGRVILVRGTRLPSEPDLRDRAFRSEITRTLVAAGPLLAGAAVSGAVLMAAGPLARGGQAAVSEVVGRDVPIVDPHSLLEGAVEGISPDELALRAGHRVVALAGASGFASATPDSKIDFKHPKRRPPKRQNRTRIALASAAALLLLTAGGSWWYAENKRLNEELADYEAQIESKQGLLETAQKRVAELREVDTFLQGSPNFLAELAFVSERIPPAEKVLISAPRMNTTSDGIGIMAMNIAADSSATISQFEASLRDDHHIVKGSNYEQLDDPNGIYQWVANERIAIVDRGWKLVPQLTGAGALPGAGRSTPTDVLPDNSSPDEAEVSEGAAGPGDGASNAAPADAPDASAPPAASEEESPVGQPPAGATEPPPDTPRPPAPVPDENKRASSDGEPGSAA